MFRTSDPVYAMCLGTFGTTYKDGCSEILKHSLPSSWIKSVDTNLLAHLYWSWRQCPCNLHLGPFVFANPVWQRTRRLSPTVTRSLLAMLSDDEAFWGFLICLYWFLMIIIRTWNTTKKVIVSSFDGKMWFCIVLTWFIVRRQNYNYFFYNLNTYR